MRVTVVGGGIIGLSCAVRLARPGWEVTVITAHPLADTASMAAGGLIYPRFAEPADRCAGWTAASVAEFRRLAGQQGTGVRLLPGRLLRREDRPVPEWADAVGGISRHTGLDGPWLDALAFAPPLVDTMVYLEWLAGVAAEAGVRTVYRELTGLDQARPGADLVVNAAGLGARELAPDPAVYPARGQVVHVRDPGLAEWVVDEDGFSYVLPHGGHVVCGGTEEVGSAALEPDEHTTADILRRCRALEPALEGVEVLRTRVGLRPARPEVRLERADEVIHCYGHGGMGITLSWGCADEVAALATES
ncbi:NAD(P)/FAD-dependent oxidoreductase [Amycolatopsis cihanbeyliensis]|uniref:D-amino-acid oxidase n=1 Tax=Amycolatopsis cihanbeyliensis TaxID=1128664 RepID=A0A542DD58_AMYCI|nr:FAD-dependent oxidoreductase [Amycolatopsis cihanbeyliensis]TQJ01009.1 D-amino-acid:oxygen oxidoreductase (deaminating) [Amycolatopsis cihanbeyliensis]